jgi:hypothetical protein
MATPTGPTVVAVVTVFVTGPLRRPDHLDTPGLLRGAGRLYRTERDDLDTLEPVLDLGAEDGTNLLIPRNQSPLDDTLGLARTGGAPRP